MAGRRIGYVQAAIMLAGFFLATGFMLWYIATGVRAALSMMGTEIDWQAQYRPYVWVAKSGVVLCVFAWTWSLLSSITILRESKGGQRSRSL
jgi:hypothetical protein